MKKDYSTYASLFTETPDAAVVFDQWMSERNNEQEVRAEIQEELPCLPTQDSKKLDKTVDAYDGDIKEGQIRILSKRFTVNPDIIPYVAVLEKEEDGMWLVAPFSQYATPATTGEMKSGIDTYGLRVLQAWNARKVQEQLLEKSFLFDKIDDSVRDQVITLIHHELDGIKLPADFNAECGFPITMEADPRRDYQEESIARLRPLSTAVKAMERVLAELEKEKEKQERTKAGIIKVDFSRFCVRDEEDYALAAAEATKQKTEIYTVCDTELSLTHSPEEKTVTLTFFDQDDQPDAAYNGYGLLGEGYEFLGTFQNGSIRVPADRVKNWFQITDPDGKMVKLTPRR